MVKNYGQGDKWIQGVILASTGPISYKISYDGGKAKRSDEIEFHDIKLPNAESVVKETLIPNNTPKLSPLTESAHN